MSKKLALISVSDKTGVISLAQHLQSSGFQIISTGGTATKLREAQIGVTDVSDITGFPEGMGGRLKTIHPLIAGGLLGDWNNPDHCTFATEQGIRTISVLVANLYPFVEVIKDPDCDLEKAIENIDIGGPTMVRAAAKNYRHTSILSSPEDYQVFIEALRNDSVDEQFNLGLAKKAFAMTTAYDAAITEYLLRNT